MKLNRREFLQTTGLAGLLVAFGIELPEVEARPKASENQPLTLALRDGVFYGGSGSCEIWNGEEWVQLGPVSVDLRIEGWSLSTGWVDLDWVGSPQIHDCFFPNHKPLTKSP